MHGAHDFRCTEIRAEMVHLPGCRGNCKFAILGLTEARVDIPEGGVTLPDATQVLTQFPIALNPQWQQWLGLEYSRISSSNLVLLQTSETGFGPDQLAIYDDASLELAVRLDNVFTMLRLLGTIEYGDAVLVVGYAREDTAVCQNVSKLARLEATKGCLPWMVREENLAAAADLARAKRSLAAKFPDANKVRLFRGWRLLTSALQENYSSDRIHGFVQALEALVYPEIAKTESQFVHRCSLFAAPSGKKVTAQEFLREAYAMRCDVEHVHEWDRSLSTYPVADREDIAFWRTRQMETLACVAYARIFKDQTIQQHFYSDGALEQFWKKLEHETRAAFGNVCDISELKLVKKYDPCGRAHFSEWPVGWKESLERKYAQPKAVAAPGFGL